jgi:branched-chain amino acid transport system permease protein
MEKTATIPTVKNPARKQWLRSNLGVLVSLTLLAAMPFVVALLTGQSISSLLANQRGTASFIQGLAIEIFILAVYALSYDLILGITGLLSFGHAMFFAVGAYTLGIMLKSFHWSFFPALGVVILAGILQALLFSIVLPRVKGITFALVTLGIASVFSIVIQSTELGNYAGADVGLQGIPLPAFLNTTNERLRFYFVALLFMFAAYLVFRRFVNSPTGRVCVALRENEDRAKMLGFNTYFYKLAALTLSSITAALAGALYALHQPIVSPTIAGLGYTVIAILAILIGGIGTLSGAIIGAAVYRLLDYGLSSYIGSSSSFITGAVYVLFVLFIPFGIVGTWKLKSFRIKEGWQKLLSYIK